MRSYVRDPNDIYEIISREKWGSVIELPREPDLRYPIKYIVVTWTETETCANIEECLLRMREMQRSHRKHRGLPDIQHNFCLGGDGNVYEGRGWHHRGPTYPATVKNANKLKNKFIEVAFIDKSDNDTTDLMHKALGKLTAYGTELEVLDEGHRFFAKLPDEIKPIVIK